MKAKILISSIAALCLLVTFAEAPRRHGEDKMKVASPDNISYAMLHKAIILPGVLITNYKKKEALITAPAIPAEDFSYLEFDVTDYIKADEINLDETAVLPEASDADFSYLKFKINSFTTDSEFTADEIPESSVNENNTSSISITEPVVAEFEYLRFESKEYPITSGTEINEIGALPLNETNSSYQVQIKVKSEITNEFGYLKFDATRYYNSADLISCERVEVPEE